MKPIVNNFCNVVILGAWNKAIFNPEWVGKNIFDEQNVPQVEFSLSGEGGFKFKTDKMSIYIVSNRLNIEIYDHNNDNLKYIAKIIRNISRLLSHTPVNAFGVNWGFESIENNIFDNINDNFTNIIGNIEAQNLKRTFKIDSTSELNFSIEKNAIEVKYDFNYNYNVQNLVDVTNILGDSDDFFIKSKEKTLGYLDALYNEKID